MVADSVGLLERGGGPGWSHFLYVIGGENLCRTPPLHCWLWPSGHVKGLEGETQQAPP